MSTSCSSSEPNTVGAEPTNTSAAGASGVGETNSSRELKIFKKVLRDPLLRTPFQEFLEQQFCAENLNFYLAVEQFKEIGDFQERCAFGRRIFDRYFAMNSTEPVNIDNSTSKRIRETVDSGTFPIETYDIAQYQILHLLKYDCWPRFLRSTSNAQPTFTDEELAADDDEKNGSCQPTSTASASEHGESSTSQPSNVTTQPAGGSGAAGAGAATKEKRKSILWHGLDRFSRRLRRGDSNAPSSTLLANAGDDADAAAASGSGTSLHATGGRGVVGSAGSKRRYIFAASKQYSMPAEMTSPVKKNSLSPTHLRRRHVEPKHCQLMVGDQFNTETVTLDDPSMSVRRWTQEMADLQGMDKHHTEVVDAETGSTIDPARQAIDALQSRALRLVPVVSFIVEILPGNYSFKNPSSTPTKLLCVRARHSLSAGAVLRPLLVKYTIDINTAKIMCNGSMEPVKRSVSVGLMGGKTLTVMTEAQYNERIASGKNCAPSSIRDQCIGQQCNFIFEQTNYQFHQHGDIAYCEIPADYERNRHAHMQFHEAQNAHQAKDHALSLFNKLVRKASHAVSKTESSISAGNTKNTCSSLATSPTSSKAGGQNGASNRMSLFKNKCDKRATKSLTSPKSNEPERAINGGNGAAPSQTASTSCLASSSSSAQQNSVPIEPANIASAVPTTSNSLPTTPAVRHPAIFSTKVGNETMPNSPTISPEPNMIHDYECGSDRDHETATLRRSAHGDPASSSSIIRNTAISSPSTSIVSENQRDSTWQPAAYV